MGSIRGSSPKFARCRPFERVPEDQERLKSVHDPRAQRERGLQPTLEAIAPLKADVGAHWASCRDGDPAAGASREGQIRYMNLGFHAG